ncbi:MAG TPA: DUF2939 domain-containing protein [Caulobacteraceae bacterium]
MRILALLLTMTLCACATTTRLGAAGDVHELLLAIRDNDTRTFERHIDREALKRQIEGRLVREARASAPPALRGLGIALAQPAAEMASAALINPRALRLTAEHYGYTPDQPIPGRTAIAASLKYLDNGRVCATAKKDGPCLLIFTEHNGEWRLSGFEGDLSSLRGALARAKGGA